ncbi:MAG: peptide chain release factor N(5)-glutamine methyltransferase [Gemmatimonadota bacterium]
MSGSAASAVPEVWTVLSMILWSADYLEQKGVPNARLDAEHLLARVAGVDRLQLYLDFERPLDKAELAAFRPLLKRRAAREPLQYILGSQPFRGLDLDVEPGVLIPRPETEVLVDQVLEWVADDARTAPRALDIGTGTGAIALSLAAEGPFESVVATDLSIEAIRVAERNRDAAGMGDRIELRCGSLFEPLRDGERFDVVVSNPPYVPEVDAASLEPEVRDWEPGEALFAGADGMGVIRPLIEGAPGYLAPRGLVALEVGRGQAEDVLGIFEASDAFVNARILRDYSGRERFVFAIGA